MLNGKWIIDLEPFLDMDTLRSLDREICLGIAQSEHHLPTPGSATIGVDRTPADIEALYTQDDELIDLTQYQRRMFLRVYERATFGIRAISIHKQREYMKKHLSAYCDWEPCAKYFTGLIDWVKAAPFKEFGRIEVFVNDAYNVVPCHRDAINPGDEFEEPGDFMWLSPRNNDKRFFVYDNENTKHYASAACWFNERQPHSSDPVPFSAYSIRVDGIFTDEFKEKCLQM